MKSKKISIFTLTTMIAAAVVSLRGLPLMAKEGIAMFFYLIFSAVIFLIPASLVSAELGSAFSKRGGGVYTWVKEAFGSRWGFTAIWLQWIQNVIWYPTVLGFVAACLAYVFLKPSLSANGYFTGAVILIIYWMSTLIALGGSHLAGTVTKYGFLLGTILPGAFIIVLGLIWLDQGNPLQFLQVSSSSPLADGTLVKSHLRYFPHLSNLGNVAFLAGIILLFAGVEVQAVHANDMKNPSRQFPLSMFLAAISIFLVFTLGSFAIAAVVPLDKISLTAGLMQAFQHMLLKYKISFLLPIVGLFLAFGSIGQVMSWIDGPSRGLLHTAKQGELPPFLSKVNKKGMQINILIIQAVIVSILALLYFVMKDVSVAFFLLSAMTVSLYLVMYILLFAAGIKLRITKPDLPREYKIPGGMLGMGIVAGIGLLGVCFALLVSFFPPSNLPVGNPILYVGLVSLGLMIFVGLPLLINSFKKPGWKRSTPVD